MERFVEFAEQLKNPPKAPGPCGTKVERPALISIFTRHTNCAHCFWILDVDVGPNCRERNNFTIDWNGSFCGPSCFTRNYFESPLGAWYQTRPAQKQLNLSYPRFADDILLVGLRLNILRTMLEDFITATSLHGLQRHPTKTKSLSASREIKAETTTRSKSRG